MYTKQHRVHQAPFHEKHFTPRTFYTRQLSTTFTPTNFYTCRILLHQPAFTTETFYTTQVSHLSYTFTPTSFYTRHLLHQPAFTRDTFYTNQLLHQTPFTIFHTRHPLHQTPLTRGNFLNHKSFYTRHLLHQTPFTPNTLYIHRLLHHTFHTKHLLHQAPFTLPQAGRPGWIRASDPNAPYQNCLVVQTAARHSKTGTLNTIYFCQKRPLCQPPPPPTPPPYSHFVRKVKLRLAYRLAFVKNARITTDFRPIANIRLMYKTFAYLILGRIEELLEHAQPEDQHGFRTNRRIEEHLLSANMVIDKKLLANRLLWILSLDLSKAFDRVDWHAFMARFAITWGVSSSSLVVASGVFEPYGTNHWTLGCEP